MGRHRKKTEFRSEESKSRRFANLAKGKGFQPGVSGNPGGRPRKLPISDRLAEAVERRIPQKKKMNIQLPPNPTWGDLAKSLELPPDAAWGDLMVAGEINRAVKDSNTFHRVREAIEGPSAQRVIVSADPEAPPIAPPSFSVTFVTVTAGQIEQQQKMELTPAKTIEVQPNGHSNGDAAPGGASTD